MPMATTAALEGDLVSGMGVDYCDGSENGNLGDDILDDLESYMDDVNDRLTISRMVSDSVIRGMVNAVSQEAFEVVAAKEVEIVGLKEELRRYNLQRVHLCAANRPVETDSLIHDMRFLSQAAKQQLDTLGEHIMHVQGCNYPLDGSFDSLKATLEALSQQLHETAPELDLKICQEVEAMVFSTIFHDIKEDYERSLLDVNVVLNLVDRFKEVSTLRLELDSIHKYLVAPEHGHLSLQGSQEIDVLHRKMLSTISDGNDKCEESKISMPENLETSKLNHMNKEELYQYFRTEITKMKRDHESTVQQMTDRYFTLKREFLKEKELLKEKGPFTAFRKDKDFEMLRKNISDAILKLDDILTGSEKLSEFCNHSRDILNGLLSENHKLKDALSDKNLELCHLSSQASDATKKLSRHFVVEEKLHKLIEHLKCCLDDADIKASISEEVYKCTLRELALQIKLSSEDLNVSSCIMQEVIKVSYDEAIRDTSNSIQSDYEELSDLNSRVLQQIYGALFEEVSRNMCVELKKKSLMEDESLLILESKALAIENELKMVIEENKKLNDKVLELENSIYVREKSFDEVKAELVEKRQQLEEYNNLRTKYEALNFDRNKMVLLKDRLAQCEKQIDVYEAKVAKLNEQLELSDIKSRKSGEELAKSILELDQKHLAMLEAKDMEHNKSMELLLVVIQELSSSLASLELRTKESISWLNVRLENSGFQLNSLIPKVNVLRRKGLLCKEKLEKKCSDLQKAEAEVDLLGDEVDALLGLLEKVYVALDHYSPILQHYPGIMDILKLVRRELSGDALKAAGAAA